MLRCGFTSGTDGILGAAWNQRHHLTTCAFLHLLADLVAREPVDAPIPMKMMSRITSQSVIEEYVDGPAYGRTVHHSVERTGMAHTPVVTTIITIHIPSPPSAPTTAPRTLRSDESVMTGSIVHIAALVSHPSSPPVRLERATYGLEIRRATTS